MSAKKKGEAAARSSEPPEPPEIRRRLHISPGQGIGIAIIAAIPVLALAGAFGHTTRAAADSGALSLRVEYPRRTRHEVPERIHVLVMNRSRAMLDTVRVSFDPDYLAHAEGVSFVPEADDAFVVALAGLAPGETRRVLLHAGGRQAGRHDGDLVVAAGGDTARVRLSTIVFP